MYKLYPPAFAGWCCVSYNRPAPGRLYFTNMLQTATFYAGYELNYIWSVLIQN